MSERALRRLLLIVGGLLVAWGAVALLGDGLGEGTAPEGGVAAALEAARARIPDDIDSVWIAGAGDAIRLRRDDAGRWRVNGRGADTVTVADLWDGLRASTVDALVSRNSANHARMGVDADSAYVLELFGAGGWRARLLVGDRGPAGRGAYARMAEADEVYLLEGDLRGALAAPGERWLDKTMARVDTARLERIVLRREGETVTLRRVEGRWRLGPEDPAGTAAGDGTPAEPAAVDALLDELAGVRAVAFAHDSVTLGAAEREVVGLAAGGDTLVVLRFRRSGPGGYVGTVRGDGAVYRVGAGAVDRLVPGADALGPGDASPGGG